MKKLLASLLFAGTLAACTSMETTQSVEYMCVSATALLEAATANAAQINAAERAHVTHAVSIINPTCSQQTVPTLSDTAHQALAAALAELTTAVN